MTLEHEVILSSESNEILMEYPVHLVSVWKSTGAQGKRSECLPKGGATVEEASVFSFFITAGRHCFAWQWRFWRAQGV